MPPRLGPWGERAAAAHLERRGWTILARNFRVGHKEIDLVARRGEVVAFVEVKTRSGLAHGHPWASITRRQRAEIATVAARWIELNGDARMVFRYDAIGILPGPGGTPIIDHLQDAWGV